MSVANFFGHDDVINQMAGFKAKMREVSEHPPWMQQNAKIIERHRWNPYSMEGGSSCAVAGADFVVVASDTRQTQSDVNVVQRQLEKTHTINDSILLSTIGFHGDILELRRLLDARAHQYRYDFGRDMTVDLCSELLARNLYYRRFFPLYTGATLAGIDENGRGAVYSYDPIGCIERLPYTASGQAEPMMIPFFDCQIGNVTQDKALPRQPLTVQRAISLVKDAFRGAAEREITTGDSVRLVVAQAGQPVQRITLQLRED